LFSGVSVTAFYLSFLHAGSEEKSAAPIGVRRRDLGGAVSDLPEHRIGDAEYRTGGDFAGSKEPWIAETGDEGLADLAGHAGFSAGIDNFDSHRILLA
jgi:hypothetical protein